MNLSAPTKCKVLEMDLRPGGSFVTQISEKGGGWRPAEQPFRTAIITLLRPPMSTDYVAHVMHKNNADRNMHKEMGFYDGWGAVVEQLAKLVERKS